MKRSEMLRAVKSRLLRDTRPEGDRSSFVMICVALVNMYETKFSELKKCEYTNRLETVYRYKDENLANLSSSIRTLVEERIKPHESMRTYLADLRDVHYTSLDVVKVQAARHQLVDQLIRHYEAKGD